MSQVQPPVQQSSAAAELQSTQAALHFALPLADNSLDPALKQRAPLQELTWVPSKQATPPHWSAGYCLQCGPQRKHFSHCLVLKCCQVCRAHAVVCKPPLAVYCMQIVRCDKVFGCALKHQSRSCWILLMTCQTWLQQLYT